MCPFHFICNTRNVATILTLLSLLDIAQVQANIPGVAYTCCPLQNTFGDSVCSRAQPATEFDAIFHQAVWPVPPKYRKDEGEIQLTLEGRNQNKSCVTDFRIRKDALGSGTTQQTSSSDDVGENKTKSELATPYFFENGSMIYGDTLYSPKQYCFDRLMNEGERTELDIAVFRGDCSNQVYEMRITSDVRTQVPWIKDMFAAVAGLSCLFILANVIIYLTLRNYLNVSGWVEFAYFVALGTFSALSIPALLYEPKSDEIESVCFGLSAALQFFEIAVYSSFMMIAFDVYWMIRKSDAFGSYGEEVQESKLKLVIYLFFLLTLPIGLTTYGILLEQRSLAEQYPFDHMIPRYGLKSCMSPSWVLTDYLTFGLQCLTFLLILMSVDHIFTRLSKSTEVDDAPRVSLLSNLFFFTLTYWIMDLLKFVKPLLSSNYAENESSKQLWLVLEAFKYAQGVLVFIVFLFNRKTLRALKKKSGSDRVGTFREIFRHACCSSRSGKETPDATPLSPLMKSSSMRRTTVRPKNHY